MALTMVICKEFLNRNEPRDALGFAGGGFVTWPPTTQWLTKTLLWYCSSHALDKTQG